jgi:type I restriction enzyme M protein
MAIVGDGKSGIVCEDSLENPNNWKSNTTQKIDLNKFSILLTNPPFGSKIPVRGEEKLKQYDLCHKWKFNKETEEYVKGKVKDKEAPQILFIERSLQLLKNGGKMAIVVPDGILGNDTLSYMRSWLQFKGRILAIVDLPIETFMPNTSTKTSILIFQKLEKEKIPKNYEIFMSIAEDCGHDRRGNPTNSDDLLKIPNLFKNWLKKKKHD